MPTARRRPFALRARPRAAAARHSFPGPFVVQQGFSIGIILIAITLTAALGVALTLAEKNGNLTAETSKYRILAAAILHQAALWHDGNALMLATKGVSSNAVCIGCAYPYNNMMDPVSGTMENQPLPPDAFVNSSNAVWVYKSTSSGYPVVNLRNVGTSSADLVVAVVNLTRGVCQQLNNLLTGSTVIPVETVGTSSAWSTAATSMDLSAETAVDGQLQHCVQAQDGPYVFYSTVRAY